MLLSNSTKIVQRILQHSIIQRSFLEVSASRCYSPATSALANRLDVSGIFPPIPTSFNNKGEIDFVKLESNFDIWNQIPFKGYVVLGSNGEAIALSNPEKVKLLSRVRTYAKKDSVIIAGLGCYGTEETIELCKEVGNEKIADAVLIITPSFFKGQMSDSALRLHYEAVADKSPLPVLLYSVPSNTNIDLGPSIVRALANHPNIIGLKDSGGDITKISRIAYETQGMNFQILAGSAGFLLPALLMGCVGGVCGLANTLGTEVCQLYKLFQEKKFQEAVSLQRRLILPNSLVTRELGVPGLKYSMDMLGLNGGPCRAPLLPLNPSQIKYIKEAFSSQEFYKE